MKSLDAIMAYQKVLLEKVASEEWTIKQIASKNANHHKNNPLPIIIAGTIILGIATLILIFIKKYNKKGKL